MEGLIVLGVVGTFGIFYTLFLIKLDFDQIINLLKLINKNIKVRNKEVKDEEN